MTNAPPPPQPADDDLVDKGRLASFSVDVISIALTPSVLDVRLPPDPDRFTVALAVPRRAAAVLYGGNRVVRCS